LARPGEKIIRLLKVHDMPLAGVSRLLASGFHEERLLSLLMLVSLFARGTEAEQHAVYNVYLKNTCSINNWDLVDCSAQHIVGAYLLTRNREPIYRLARSTKIWERRISTIRICREPCCGMPSKNSQKINARLI